MRDDRRLTELEMDVAGAEIDGLGEDVVEVHSRPIGRRGRNHLAAVRSTLRYG